MTTTPSPEGLSIKLENDWRWLVSHIVLLLVLAGAVTGGIYLVDGLLAKRAAENDARWKAILGLQQQQTISLQKQITTEEAQWQKIQAQLLQQNSQLAAEVVARDKQTAEQVQHDKNLNASQAAERLATLTQAQPSEVVVNGNSLDIDLPTSTRIIGDLDLLGGTQADLAATKQQLTNETTLYTNSQADLAEQKKLVANTQTLVTDTQQQCKAEVKALKAKQRKNIFKAVFVGIGIGLGLGIHYF